MDSPPTNRPSLAQVCLGLFVLWQLFFLGASNLLELFPHRPEERDELTDYPEPRGDVSRLPSGLQQVARLTDHWAEFTNQNQVWWLFAPGFPLQATHPAVELRWQDDPPSPGAPPPIHLRSQFEPDDLRSYCHLPGSSDRLYHYEVRLGLVLVNWDNEQAAKQAKQWRELIFTRVRRQWKSIRAYLRYRVREFQQELSNVPAPQYAILSLRIYRTPPLGQRFWSDYGPVEVPLARWRPAEDGPADCLPIEVYDPFAGRFERLPLDPTSEP
jgi:hypothetical protein